MPSEITLKQLSKYSGFSISTISKALNDKSDVSKNTKCKIKKLAKNFNYTPNNAAITLRSKKTKIIGVIVPNINSEIYGNIVSKIQETAFKKGYRIILLQSFKNEEKELECINNIRDGCVDGIILIKPNQKSDCSFNKILLTKYFSSIPTVVKVMDNLDLDKGYIIGEKSLNVLLDKINKA